MPCTEISAEWASQRIKNLDLKAAVKSALLGSRSADGEVITTLIDRFHYPRLGPGMMWERCRDRLSRGGQSLLRMRVTRVRHENGHRMTGGRIRARGPQDAGSPAELAGHRLDAALGPDARVDPPPPPEVRGAAAALPRLSDRRPHHRPRGVFPDTWIYVHDSEVKLGRIQNFKNWSPEMVPDTGEPASASSTSCSEATSCGPWTTPR